MTDHTALRIAGDRLWSTLTETAQFGAIPGTPRGMCRLTLSEADVAVRRWLIDAATAIGMTVTIDKLGTIHARRPGSEPGLAPIAIGSHLDTQPTGGRFDGILGVLAGLEVVRTLHDAGITTRHPIEVINWTNEEGARFAPAMVASGVFAGEFTLDYALAQTDRDGITLAAALDQAGFAGAAEPGAHALAAHFELHIEQGPVLEAEGIEIGVVNGVQGIRWYDVVVKGQTCHAGTTPMALRRDALQAAARLAVAVDHIGRSDPGRSLSTIGLFQAYPGSRNTAPGEVRLTVDLRHPEVAGLDLMEVTLRDRMAEVERETGCTIALNPVWYSPPVRFDPGVIDAIAGATQRLGYTHRTMPSGAGHDSVYTARVAPTGMIFIPCENGISHNIAENVTPAQATQGANVLLQAVLDYDRRTA
ncbi:M20 family metallo-hydrolase [Novosphingobium sp.]|uniref:M20 family metallo-hydrolase n=1 Tax=Novosphingobium sp. TaxID=1874826 RepID=UPI003342A373